MYLGLQDPWFLSHGYSNNENRAADRFLEIRILIKDCDFYLFERLRILKFLKLKRSFN